MGSDGGEDVEARLEAGAGGGFGAEFFLLSANAGLRGGIRLRVGGGLQEAALVGGEETHEEFDVFLLVFDLLLEREDFRGFCGCILSRGCGGSFFHK